MNSKNTSLLKYFSYFKNIAGRHMYGYILVNLLVGLLDGLGLAMFIPLLGIASGINANTGDENSDVINFIVNLFDSVGVNLNLVNALLFMVVVFSIKGVFYYLRNVYFIKIRVKSVSLLRLNLIKSLNELSYSGFTKLEAGRIQNTMVGELGKVIGALMSFFVYLQHIIMLATYIFLAFIANWQFAILVAIGGSLSNLFYKYINNYTKEKATLLSSKGNSFNAILIQILHNFKYLKATNHYQLFSKKLVNNIHEQEKINLGVGKISSIGESLREPFTIVIITGVIIVQTSYLGESFSSILLSLLLFYRALGHLVSMQNSWNTFLANSSGIDSFETLLSDFKHYQEPLHYQEKIEHIDDISIKNISLSFRGKKAIDNISFSIKKNSSVAFVGESGAGKTTLANIISGLQTPDDGEIIIEGKSLYKTNLNFFRNHLGYITQEAVIFNDSIFNNVTFWQEKSEENEEKFRKTIEKVSLSEFLNELPEKENTQLGNNGILISGGQKQRISIARELYKDVELLILDEATSALDTETERHIKNNIDLLQGQTTLIIIAHRLSTIKNVDIIYLLDKGKIIASGNFDSLIKSSEKFRKMVELQEL
ncbi:MAG: ABC transporter ATP-binding protein [Flavobacteriaceae bacterium]|nr:ABC transporter ATP-binding protein [Flavobacteriaceae bacterium]